MGPWDSGGGRQCSQDMHAPEVAVLGCPLGLGDVVMLIWGALLPRAMRAAELAVKEHG